MYPYTKKDNKEMGENYRPIHPLNNVSRVMERLVFNHAYPVIEPQIYLTCMVRLVRRLIKEGK